MEKFTSSKEAIVLLKKSNKGLHHVLKLPSLDEAFRTIKNGISRHKTVLVAGNCWVDYDGRASSKLEEGERIAIFKSDGSALVHRPRDYSPVNWQPPGSIFRTSLKKDILYINVYRRKDNELLEAKFNNVILVAVLDLKDSGPFYLYSSEEDMKKAILLQPSLLEEGFRPIKSEKTVEPGFIDILGVDKENILTIVEIKRNPATREAILQLKKYIDVFAVDEKRKIRGIIVAPELARGAQKMLASLKLEFKPLSPQKCSEVLKSVKTKQLTDFF